MKASHHSRLRVILCLVLALCMPSIARAGSTLPTGLEQLIASGMATQYQRVSCYDQTVGCEAVRSIAPMGWAVGGESTWMLQSFYAPAVVNFVISSPDGRAFVGYTSAKYYTQPNALTEWYEGDWATRTGPSRTYESAQAHLARFFQEDIGYRLDWYNPFQLRAEDWDAMNRWLAAYAQHLAPVRAQGEATARQINTQMQTQYTIDGALSTMGFHYNGASYKALGKCSVLATHIYMTTNYQGMGTYTTEDIYWSTPSGYYYYIAEEGAFDQYLPVAEMFWDNLVPNLQWNAAITNAANNLYNNYLQELSYELLRRTQQELMSQSNRYAQQSEPNYSGSSDSSDTYYYDNKVMDGWTNVLTEQSYYDSPDGGYLKLDNQYSHAYADGSGGIIQTNENLSLPSGWTELTERGPMLP